MRRLGRVGGLVLLTLLIAACRGATDQPPLPDEPATVEVELDEYAFTYQPPIPSGRVVFEVRNRGDELHQLVLVRLPDEADLDELLDSPTPRALPPVYTVPAREPGGSASFAVDLTPGRYGLLCFVEADDGAQHHEKGMVSQFKVE